VVPEFKFAEDTVFVVGPEVECANVAGARVVLNRPVLGKVDAVLGTVVETSAVIVLVGKAVMVLVDAVGVPGGSVVFVGVEVGDIVSCTVEIDITVTAIVMFSGDTVEMTGGSVVLVSVVWLRAGAVSVKSIVVLDRGAVVIWNAVVVAAVGVLVF